MLVKQYQLPIVDCLCTLGQLFKQINEYVLRNVPLVLIKLIVRQFCKVPAKHYITELKEFGPVPGV